MIWWRPGRLEATLTILMPPQHGAEETYKRSSSPVQDRVNVSDTHKQHSLLNLFLFFYSYRLHTPFVAATMRWSFALCSALLVAGASAAPHADSHLHKKSSSAAVTATRSSSAIPSPSSGAATGSETDPTYWLADITHQAVAPYAGSNYTVFRNVKDYGAAGE